MRDEGRRGGMYRKQKASTMVASFCMKEKNQLY